MSITESSQAADKNGRIKYFSLNSVLSFLNSLLPIKISKDLDLCTRHFSTAGLKWEIKFSSRTGVAFGLGVLFTERELGCVLVQN